MRHPLLAQVCSAVLPTLLLVGCALTPSSGGNSKLTTQNLTPQQYQMLKDPDKVRYKNVVVRVPESWGGALLPFDKGPYSSPIDKAVHTGDLNTLMGLYNQSLFELQHPSVKIEYVNFDMWSDNFRSALAVALASHRAPAYYIARDLPQTIDQGMYADLTPLMRNWNQFKLQPEGSVRQGTVNGHIYTLAGNELSATVIRYRKDWFREAGIFNEKGQPGPRSDWTWEDFRRIARKLTDPGKGRYGFCGELGDFLYDSSHGVDRYIPDPSGRHTWIFNDRDPELLKSLQAARDMVNVDRSVLTGVSYGWTEWHNEFDASHAAMIVSWAAHIPRESLEQPEKFGKDRPYAQTVGMVTPPESSTGLSSLEAETNPIGFDPTLSAVQLRAAFEWCKSWFYGDIFENRIHSESLEAKTKKQQSALYAEVLALPYEPAQNPLTTPLEKVFPQDYLDTYRSIRQAHSPPLPRAFGLREPAVDDMNVAFRAMYSEAITGHGDLKALIAKTAHLVNTNDLGFRRPDDAARLRRYVAARTSFYRKYFPRYYATEWQTKLKTEYARWSG